MNNYLHVNRKYKIVIFDLFIGAICLSIPALYNGYPLVTSDSGAYINSVYSLQLPMDRPITYSWFVRLTSLGASLWGVVAVQALILSGLLLIITRHILGISYNTMSFIVIVLTLTLTTSVGWFTGQIMPDIFTAMLLLCICIRCTVSIGIMAKWTIYCLIFLCIIMHNSNLLVVLLIAILIGAYGLKTKSKLWRKTSIETLVIGTIGWITLSGINATAKYGFRPSAAPHVFLMGRMIENGIMDDFLSDYCPVDSNKYKLCAYKLSLPNRTWDFMWNEESALYKTGGWEANESEYNRIILKTITTPKYLAMHLIKGTEATFRQIPLIYVGDGLNRYDETSSPDQAIKVHVSSELREFRSAAQQTNSLCLQYWNVVIVICSMFTIIIALVMRLNLPKLNKPDIFGSLTRLSFLFIVCNAAITAIFSTVLGRYESRVFWVLPFFCLLYILQTFNTRQKLLCSSNVGQEVV